MGMYRNAVVLNTDTMSYHAGFRTITAEASDCGFGMLNRMYDDAIDIGVFLKSHLTGKVEPFYFDKRIRDDSGEDILSWVFKNDKLGVYLNILND